MPNLLEEMNSISIWVAWRIGGRELKEMNKRKRGAPYKYPKTFMTFSSIKYSFFRMPYRQLEGFIERIFAYKLELLAADYTTLHKRIFKQDLGIDIP